MRTTFCLALLTLATSPALAEGPLRVDLSAQTGRADAETFGWREWEVGESASVNQTFDGVGVTLRGVGGPLVGFLHKPGLATGATLASDGVTAQGSGIELVLSGLTAGKHALATHHNIVKGESTPLVVSVAGAESRVTASRGAEHDDEAAGAYVEFTAEAGKPVTIAISGEGAVLNGFEVDGADPTRKARRPTPSDFDEHADGGSGRVDLAWFAPDSARRYRVYLTSNRDWNAAVRQAREAGPGSPTLVEETNRPMHTVEVDPNDSLMHYCWRVDAVDAQGAVCKGEVWSFRVRHLAFPGAEGYGRLAIGGRGGRVYHVTSLADSGPGTLREAVEAQGARTVVFDVSGRIVLKDRLVVRNDYLTIAGQTAPGKGVCISNYNLGMLGAHDVILRYLRVRPGDTAGKTLDGMGMASSDHSIIDHCSISWTQDESFSSRGAKNITLQRTLISEALNVAGHKKYKPGTQHGYAASIGGDIGSFHHNLLAHCAGRNWSLAGSVDQATRHAGQLDIRNNVVFNWGYRTTDGGAQKVQFVANYYKPGPASRVFHVLKPERELVGAFGPQDYYVEGNVMEGHYGPEDRLAGVVEPREEPLANFLVDKPFFPHHVQSQSAEEAYEDVLADVGCNVPALDEHDQRVLRETRDGTTTYKGSQTGYPGLPDSQEDVGGWEDYPEVSRPAGWDIDADGMPGAWEEAHGLDPSAPADGAADRDGDGYTNLEEYLNSLATRPEAQS